MKKSRKIAVVALTMWMVSLVMPAIVLYDKEVLYTGTHILLLGWLSGNAAWFSNFFFIWSIAKIFSIDKAPIFSSTMAVLLSLDTFRLSEVLIDEGGGTSDVYGYSMGAVIWGLSILLALVSAGLRYVEQSENMEGYRYISPRSFKNSGLSCLVIYLVVVIVKYSSDHMGYIHPSEVHLLTADVIKRGKPCRSPVMRPQKPPLLLKKCGAR